MQLAELPQDILGGQMVHRTVAKAKGRPWDNQGSNILGVFLILVVVVL